MSKKNHHLITLGFFFCLCHLSISVSYGAKDSNEGNSLDTSGVQSRIGMVTKIRVTAGETRFLIDSCPEDQIAPAFFVIAANNQDKLDITRLLIAAMSFKKRVKVYNTSYDADINHCPRTGLSTGNVTVGTVRVQ